MTSTFFRQQFAILVAGMLPLMANAGIGQDSKSYSRENNFALEKIDALLSLGKQPDSISVEVVESLFNARLQRDSCDEQNASCRWSGDFNGGDVSLTNFFVPNPIAKQYLTGGKLMLELPRSSCITLAELTNHVRSTPSPLGSPAAEFSYSDENSPIARESLFMFTRIPGMSNQISLNSWMINDCLVRIELNALLTRKE